MGVVPASVWVVASVCSTAGFSTCLTVLFLCSLLTCCFEVCDSGSDVRISGTAVIQIIDCSCMCLILCVDASFPFTDVFSNILLWPKPVLGFVYMAYSFPG